MTKYPKKKTSTTWVKGVSGNPLGCPIVPPEIKAMKVHSRADLTRLCEFVQNADKPTIVARLNEPTITMLEETFLRAALADMQRGTDNTMRYLIERVHGKTIQPIVAQVGVRSLEEILEGSSG
jgi:hypothetical protein